MTAIVYLCQSEPVWTRMNERIFVSLEKYVYLCTFYFENILIKV